MSVKLVKQGRRIRPQLVFASASVKACERNRNYRQTSGPCRHGDTRLKQEGPPPRESESDLVSGRSKLPPFIREEVLRSVWRNLVKEFSKQSILIMRKPSLRFFRAQPDDLVPQHGGIFKLQHFGCLPHLFFEAGNGFFALPAGHGGIRA